MSAIAHRRLKPDRPFPAHLQPVRNAPS